MPVIQSMRTKQPAMQNLAPPLGVYVSIPFCRAKCSYCNFASGVYGSERMAAYVEMLTAEIRRIPSVRPHGVRRCRGTWTLCILEEELQVYYSVNQ